MSFKKVLSELPDRFLLSLPNIEEGKTISYQEYYRQLEFYHKIFISNRDSFYKNIAVPTSIKYDIENERRSNKITETLYSFSSNYKALNHELQQEINSYTHNLKCYVNIWQQNKNNPTVLCIHGLKMGGIKTSYKMFKIESLLKKGLNVAVIVQPHHGLRSSNKLKQFFLNPGNIPLTIEAARQAVNDGIQTIQLLKNIGLNRIGIVGASLGGFTALNIAINSDIPEFVFASQPAISFENYIKKSKANMKFYIDAPLEKLITSAMKIISPMYHIPKLPNNKIAVLYHTSDLITPAKNIEKLLNVWDIKNTASVEGGHWLYFDKSHTRGRFWYSWLSKFNFISQKK